MMSKNIANSLSSGVDYAMCGRLLQRFTDRRLLRQGKQLHARLVLSSSPPENFLGSKLIAFYAKTSNLSLARHVFDQITHKNTFSYNALLIAYSINSRHLDAVNLFSRLCSQENPGLLAPDKFSVTCLLKSLSSLLASFTDLKLSREVHGFSLRRDLVTDNFVENALITYYARCDDFVSAKKAFDKMRDRDVVTWNSMIAAYSQGGSYDDCKRLYREMIDFSGLKPNAVTISSVLQACGQSSDLIFGMEVHKYVVDEAVGLDVSAYNALIGLYAKCGSMDYAMELFEEMKEKDDVTYSAIISGFMTHGFVHKALGIFRGTNSRGLNAWNAVISGLVQNNQHEGVLDFVREMQIAGLRPNGVTLSSILPTLSYFSHLKGGKEIHAYAMKNDFDRNIYVATAIIDIYAKSGFIGGARLVFNRSKDRSVIIWTAIISAYSAHGDVDSAFSLFDEMLCSGVQPDEVTITAVLAACAHGGMVDEAWEVLNITSRRYGIQPSMEHCACMVGVLSRAGRLSEATEYVSKMPIEPSAKVWGALLCGASLSGDVELGKFVCDRLFEIEPENTANYVVMANLYSQTGRWKEADEVRERMNRNGMKKVPGSSWTETSRILQRFVTKDKSSERPELKKFIFDTGRIVGLTREE